MTILLAIIAGIVGGALGWAAAAAATIVIGGWMGMSDFEGGRAMTAIFGIGPLGGLAGLLVGVALVLRLRGGHAGAGLAWRIPAVIAAIGCLVAGGLWWMYETRPVLNTDGPAPRLAFEVRLPAGLTAPSQAIKAELHTEKNRMPGRVAHDASRIDDGRTVITGDVELYYRSAWRLLEIKVPGQDDRIFTLRLPASPRRTTELGPWERAAYIAAPGLSQPRKSGPDEGYEIRYRVVWPQ